MPRIRFEIQSLSSLGPGVHRLPINCWRLTIIYIQNDRRPSVLVDGVNLFADLETDRTGPASGVARIVVGGVMLGSAPVNLDQILSVVAPGDGLSAQGILVYEYLEA